VPTTVTDRSAFYLSYPAPTKTALGINSRLPSRSITASIVSTVDTDDPNCICDRWGPGWFGLCCQSVTSGSEIGVEDRRRRRSHRLRCQRAAPLWRRWWRARSPDRASSSPPGTLRRGLERCFPRRAASCIVYSGSVRQSGICTARRSRAVRPTTDPLSTLIGCSDLYLTHSASALFEHAMWYFPSRNLNMTEYSDAQGWPKGNLLEVACALLPIEDRDASSASKHYGVTIREAPQQQQPWCRDGLRSSEHPIEVGRGCAGVLAVSHPPLRRLGGSSCRRRTENRASRRGKRRSS
jgi:hypothetical protein